MADFQSRNLFKSNLFFFLFLIAIFALYTCGGGGGTSSVDTGSLPSDTLILTPASGDFGSVTQGHSATTVITVSNPGPTAIDVLSMTISDPANFDDSGWGKPHIGCYIPSIIQRDIHHRGYSRVRGARDYSWAAR